MSESFGLVIAEAKLFAVPNILVGLDYVSIAKGRSRIVYDDTAESVSKEAFKILHNYNYREELGKEGRISMINFNNKFLFKKWNKLILSVYNGNDYYQKIRESENRISEIDAINILQNQIRLLKLRQIKYFNLTIIEVENFTIMENLVY